MSKKSIIAIIAIVVLLFIAGLSVGIFLYNNGETEAVDGNQIIEENQNTDGNQKIEENQNADGNQIINENQVTEENQENKNSEINPEANNENTTTNSEIVNEDVENTDNVNSEGTENDNTQNNNTEVSNEVTNVENIEETTITRVEEQERLISKDFWDWWKPMEVKITPTQVGVNLPQISVKKLAITGVGGDQFVYAGQDITYVIAVTNNGDSEVKNIEITDKVPQNTTFVSIEDAIILKEVNEELTSEIAGTKATIGTTNNIEGLKWVVTIPAGETVIARFTVKVNETMINENGQTVETTGTILNTAIANGKESNEGEPTKTAIIRTNKTSEITRLNKETQKYEKVESAKIGDLITYKITVENTGDTEGSTYITDKIPEGTKLIIAEGAIISDTVDSVAWSVTLGANETITKEFTVEVINVNGKIKNIADVGGTPTNEDEIETANINVEKIVTDIKRKNEAGKLESIGTDAKAQSGDVIEYKITVTNTGSKDLENVVLDEKLEGVVLKQDELQIGNLAAGEFVEINASYTVTYERDIKNKADREILNEVYVSGETVVDPKNPEEESEKVEDNDDVTTPVEEVPSLDIIKIADRVENVKAGDIVNYTITVTNTGNVTLLNVPVTDELTTSAGVQNLTIYADSEYTTPVTEITRLEVTGEGSSIALYAKYEVTQADIDAQTQITNIAKAGETPSDPVPVTPEAPNRKLYIEKEVINNKEPYALGEIVEYKVTVTNIGNMTLSGIKLTDKINNTTDIVEAVEINANGEKIETRDLTTYEFRLIPGESAYFTYKYTVTESDMAIGTISNLATATAPQTPSVTDTEIVDTEDSITLTNISLKKGVAEKLEDNTFKAIEGEELSNKIYIIGDTVWYSITVTNNHIVSGSVTVTDELPKGIEYVSATETIESTYDNTADRYKITWNVADLPAGESKTIYISGTIKENAIEGKEITETIKTENQKKEIYIVNNIATALDKSSDVDIKIADITELVTKTVSKIWDDNNNKDGERPQSVTVQLLQNNVETGATVELKSSNSWSYTWTGLEPKDENEEEIIYTVKEVKVGTENIVDNRTSKYVTSQSTDEVTGNVTITNTYDPEIVATKIATTENGTISVEKGKTPVKTGDTAIQVGDTITYTIKLENKGRLSKDATVQDTIPAHTALVENTTVYLDKVELTSEQLQQFYNGTLVVTVPANDIIEITFSVKVVSGNAGDEVSNTAIVNGEEVGPTVNPIEKIVNVTKYKNNIASTNIVLVLDTSSSMNRYPSNDKNAPEGQRRIDIAKKAIKAFVNSTYEIDKNADVTFTLVTFNNRSNTELFTFNDGTNSNAWIVTKSTKEQFNSAVDDITTGVGTNMRAGLEKAYDTLYGTGGLSTLNEYKNFEKILIFFGDGEPYGEDTGEGLNTAIGIKAEADLIRSKGTKIYSIGFGPDVTAGETGYDRLSDIADGGVVYNSDNYETLVRDFSKIAGRDPSYDQITVDGSAVINITSNAQDIVVNADNPIIITVNGNSTTITNTEQAAANNITYTTKNITWNVSTYAESATLAITYYVQ